jgi:hypothetical protein
MAVIVQASDLPDRPSCTKDPLSSPDKREPGFALAVGDRKSRNQTSRFAAVSQSASQQDHRYTTRDIPLMLLAFLTLGMELGFYAMVAWSLFEFVRRSL